jgi:hypothetical protein
MEMDKVSTLWLVNHETGIQIAEIPLELGGGSVTGAVYHQVEQLRRTGFPREAALSLSAHLFDESVVTSHGIEFETAEELSHQIASSAGAHIDSTNTLASFLVASLTDRIKESTSSSFTGHD